MKYDLMVFINEDCDKIEVVDKIKMIVKNHNGTIKDEITLNGKTMLQPAKNKEKCSKYEASCHFENKEDVQEASKELNFADGVLRYLLCIGD